MTLVYFLKTVETFNLKAVKSSFKPKKSRKGRKNVSFSGYKSNKLNTVSFLLTIVHILRIEISVISCFNQRIHTRPNIKDLFLFDTMRFIFNFLARDTLIDEFSTEFLYEFNYFSTVKLRKKCQRKDIVIRSIYRCLIFPRYLILGH